LILFWLSAALIAYAYLLFPAIIFVRGRFFKRPIHKAGHQPSVSLVMAMHNEQDDLPAKLANLQAMHYPREKFEVVITSDGSSDRTNQILQAWRADGFRMLLLPRVGKAAALNAAVEQACGEILVFSDANSIYAPDAIQRLAAPFADPQVGGVAGNQRYLKIQNNNLSQAGEKSYWNFDRLMKIYESRAGNVISATGAIYAIRRSLFQPIIDGVTDDFYTSTAVIEQGFRLVFEPDAVSYEPVSAGAEHEFRRKVRIMTRGLGGVMARRKLLNPLRYGFYALQLFSHKVLRRLVVFPLLVVFITSLVLASYHPLYALAAAAQLVFYGLALAGYFLRGRRSRILKIATIPFYFSLVNLAALLAAFNVLRGNRIALWEPKRPAQPQPSAETEPGLARAGRKQGTR
jgi:cellulose synthase/poly-beta-1,6-N-acetylglucosamine synthase-like glycosyltransferase